MSALSVCRRTRGFTLIEVMVALLVIAIGLLGIAKMQLLALSETGISSERSLAAIEAASLASSMHANRTYWASGFAPSTFTVTGTTVSDSNLAQTAACDSGQICTAPLLAAYDVQQWAQTLKSLLPNPVSTIGCNSTPGVPVSCTIEISWTEKQVGVNAQGANGPKMTGPDYTLYVEP